MTSSPSDHSAQPPAIVSGAGPLVPATLKPGRLFTTTGLANTNISNLQSINQQIANISRWQQDFASLWPVTSIPETKEHTLLSKILRLYEAAMAGDVRTPLVHLVGPPGCGKSHSVEQAAELLGVNLHIINVSRVNPLELEGVQMPDSENTGLTMLTATWWTQLEEGDIVLFDEFLRGFPEVYNGLLDILTSRRVGPFRVPKVFFIGASNSVSTYDAALEDRLLHLPVNDPRSSKREQKHLANILVEATGMLPEMATSVYMEDLLKTEVFPMYDLLDQFSGAANRTSRALKGTSIRKLIGQVKLRELQCYGLRELILANNQKAINQGHFQYVILPNGTNPDPRYVERAPKLQGNSRLTEIQKQNLDLNLQLIQMELALTETEPTEEENIDDPVF